MQHNLINGGPLLVVTWCKKLMQIDRSSCIQCIIQGG